MYSYNSLNPGCIFVSSGQTRFVRAALDFLIGSRTASEAEADLVVRLKRKYADMLNLAEDQDEVAALDEKIKILNRYHDVLNNLIQIRRKELTRLRKEKRTSDEIINKRERELDLEESHPSKQHFTSGV